MTPDLLTALDRRHSAFLAAKAVNFGGCPATAAWREANRAYVDAKRALNGSPRVWNRPVARRTGRNGA